MQSVIFKSSIIFSFITVMIVVLLLTVICDLKYLIVGQTNHVNVSLIHVPRSSVQHSVVDTHTTIPYRKDLKHINKTKLHMFLSNLRSKGE